MRNSKNTWLRYKWKEIYENEKTFLSLDGKVTIWKSIWWNNITIDILEELLEKGKTTNLIEWFKSMKWNIFPARLKFNWHKVSYDF